MDSPDQKVVHRVAWLICGDESYGMGTAYLSLHKGLQAYGWPVSAVAMVDGPMAQALRDRGVTVQCMSAIGARWPFHVDGGTLGRLRKLMLRHRLARRAGLELAGLLSGGDCDAVYVRWPGILPVASRAATRLGIPCLWHAPNAFSMQGFRLSSRRYQWECLRYGIVPIGNSVYTAQTLGQWPVRPKVVYLGVDPEVFCPDRVTPVLRCQLGIPESAIVLGVVAVVNWAKGQPLLLRAILSLGEAARDIHLLLVGKIGSPDALASMRATAEQAGALHRLHFVGEVADPERYWPVADIAVSGFVGAEAFGLSIVEAMMMARPALVHAKGGPAETVLDGLTGWHVHDASVASFACGVNRALAQRRRWVEMGLAARRRALENFSSKAYAQGLMRIVCETIAQRRGKNAAPNLDNG